VLGVVCRVLSNTVIFLVGIGNNIQYIFGFGLCQVLFLKIVCQLVLQFFLLEKVDRQKLDQKIVRNWLFLFLVVEKWVKFERWFGFDFDYYRRIFLRL